MKTFKELGLSDTLLETLGTIGFETPTEIQERAIPLLTTGGRDFIGLAQTGTGKTAAFGLPLLQLIDPEYEVIQSLILAPTRELSQQIAEQLVTFSKNTAVRIEVVYGGTNIVPQMKRLRQKPPHILVATPGRLIDLANRKAIRLGDIEFVVLDEADEMLNMGFREDLDTILKFTPEQKTTWLFSATMPDGIRKLTKSYMEQPEEVRVSKGMEVNANIEHRYTLLKASDKTEALRRFIDVDPELYGVVFCRTKRDTQRLADDLISKGYKVDALHGDMTQQQRDIVMRRFKSGRLQALIATDVAARGIDVSELTHVIHHSIPDAPEYYTHRSGRTARAGKKGVSLSFITRNDQRKLRIFGEKLGIEFEKVEVPPLEQVFNHKVEGLAKAFKETRVSDILTPELLEKAEAVLGDLDAKEFITLWLSRELSKHNYTKDTRDLNDKGKAKEARERRKNDNFHRFFINIGKIDKLQKGDLLRLVCDVTDIASTHIGAIRLYDKHATFEVDSRYSSKVVPKFSDVLVNGRDLRVNRDDVGRDKPSGSGKKRRPNHKRSKDGKHKKRK